MNRLSGVAWLWRLVLGRCLWEACCVLHSPFLLSASWLAWGLQTSCYARLWQSFGLAVCPHSNGASRPWAEASEVRSKINVISCKFSQVSSLHDKNKNLTQNPQLPLTREACAFPEGCLTGLQTCKMYFYCYFKSLVWVCLTSQPYWCVAVSTMGKGIHFSGSPFPPVCYCTFINFVCCNSFRSWAYHREIANFWPRTLFS